MFQLGSRGSVPPSIQSWGCLFLLTSALQPGNVSRALVCAGEDERHLALAEQLRVRSTKFGPGLSLCKHALLAGKSQVPWSNSYSEFDDSQNEGKVMTKEADDALKVLREVRERLITQRREIAHRLTGGGGGADLAKSFVDAEVTIEAVDRAIQDEEGLETSIFER